jgi:hypothetical protein
MQFWVKDLGACSKQLIDMLMHATPRTPRGT